MAFKSARQRKAVMAKLTMVGSAPYISHVYAKETPTRNIKIKGKDYVEVGYKKDPLILSSSEYKKARFRTQDMLRGH